ncbi:glycosyltransferase family 2 protein [Alphaproteobacteria bacterium]|nr:glycosyltransferase family 2 protein [Alphaproteobacteria bacterium]
MKFSVIVPTFNEEKAILDQINEIIKYLTIYKIDAEIIIVDDGSTDSSKDIIKKIKYQNIRLHSNLINSGYGFSIKKGIELANSENIIILDGDMTYPFSEINTMISYYKKGYDVVIAKRNNLMKYDGFMKSFLRQIFIFIVNFITGNKVTDPNSGFRIFKKNIFVKYNFLISNSFSMTTSSLLCFIFEKYSYKFVPVNYRNRVGDSKIVLSRDILRMLQAIFQVSLYFNPLKIYVFGFIFFMLITIFLFLLDFFPIFNFFAYKLFFLFISIQLICFGFIAEALRLRK